MLTGQRRAPSVVTFALLPPLSFALAEASERLVHAESFPFQPGLEPRFLVGLALQAPFGVVAYLLARLLTRVVEQVALALRSRPLSRIGRQLVRCWRAPAGADVPRIQALALGYPQRGPPTL